MRDRLIELYYKTQQMRMMRQSVAECVDFLLKNGVIAPLLQTGQTVYRVSKKKMWEVKIWKIEICNGTVSYIDNYDKSFLATHIGKGVFLTREEAMQALKGGAE